MGGDCLRCMVEVGDEEAIAFLARSGQRWATGRPKRPVKKDWKPADPPIALPAVDPT